MAKKVDATEEELKAKIEKSIETLEDAYNNSDKKGKLTIYGLSTYPTKTVFCSENQLIETPYQISSGRVKVPVFVYKKVEKRNSPYSFVKNDIEALKKESRLIKELGGGQ